MAALALQEFEKFDSQAQHKKNVRAAIENVAARLGNTPAICRKCYVHPEILNSYAEGALLVQVKDRVDAELRDDLAFSLWVTTSRMASNFLVGAFGAAFLLAQFGTGQAQLLRGLEADFRGGLSLPLAWMRASR